MAEPESTYHDPYQEESTMTTSPTTPASDPNAITVDSSSPKVELRPAKAVVAAIVGGVVAGGSVLLSALSDGALGLGEIWQVVGAVLAGAGLTGGVTYGKSTSVTIH